MKKFLFSLLYSASLFGADMFRMDETTYGVVLFVFFILYAIVLQNVDEREFINKENEVTLGRFLLVLASRFLPLISMIIILIGAYASYGSSIVLISFSILWVLFIISVIKQIFSFVPDDEEEE